MLLFYLRTIKRGSMSRGSSNLKHELQLSRYACLQPRFHTCHFKNSCYAVIGNSGIYRYWDMHVVKAGSCILRSVSDASLKQHFIMFVFICHHPVRSHQPLKYLRKCLNIELFNFFISVFSTQIFWTLISSRHHSVQSTVAVYFLRSCCFHYFF